MSKRDTERLLAKIAKANGGRITRAAYAIAAGILPAAATAELRRLVEEGILEMRGSRRGAHYAIV